MSDLAAEKKRAEVESDEMFEELKETMSIFLLGECKLSTLDADWENFKLAHTTERGLRYETED